MTIYRRRIKAETIPEKTLIQIAIVNGCETRTGRTADTVSTFPWLRAGRMSDPLSADLSVRNNSYCFRIAPAPSSLQQRFHSAVLAVLGFGTKPDLCIRKPRVSSSWVYCTNRSAQFRHTTDGDWTPAHAALHCLLSAARPASRATEWSPGSALTRPRRLRSITPGEEWGPRAGGGRDQSIWGNARESILRRGTRAARTKREMSPFQV